MFINNKYVSFATKGFYVLDTEQGESFREANKLGADILGISSAC
jgi:hypothetical protein